jgi:hypothetical protein
MMYSNSKLISRLLLFFCLLLFCCCQRPTTQQVSQEPIKPQQVSEKRQSTDPTTGWREEVKKAWALFVKDGRYRMAQLEDFRFPNPADGSSEELGFEKYTHRPWIAWWGAFAVIVIDNTRGDQDRFGLIMFVEPKDNWKLAESGKKPWRAVWLYRNRDLSRTWMEQASGYWFVCEYGEDGKKKTCEVKWNERQQKYTCG